MASASILQPVGFDFAEACRRLAARFHLVQNPALVLAQA